MTKRGAELLRAELHKLKTVERPATTQAIAEARGHGDLSENAEYEAAREKQGMIEGYLVQSSEGPARKYYRMSKRGTAALEQWRQDWEQFRASVDTVLEGGSYG